jgi:hypothetical protein
MEQWEYWPTYFEAKANKKEMREYLKSKIPGLKRRPPKFMVESLMPELNEMGEQGWELVHMEPVPSLGKKGDVLFGSREWSNVYFCVFKRRKPGMPASTKNETPEPQTVVPREVPPAPVHETNE